MEYVIFRFTAVIASPGILLLKSDDVTIQKAESA